MTFPNIGMSDKKNKKNKLEGRSTKPSKLCLVFFAFVCVEALLGDMVGRGLIIYVMFCSMGWLVFEIILPRELEEHHTTFLNNVIYIGMSGHRCSQSPFDLQGC